jgi:hypothetical protein
MVIENPNIVIWCGGAPNQKALANKIAGQFRVAGIVVDEQPGKPVSRKWPQLPALIWDRFIFRSIYGAWKNLMQVYSTRFPEWPANVPLLRVKGINSEETVKFTRQLNPDLIIVSGTALVRQPLLDIPATIGIINLHTGLSPYVKGGPNCTNWCIANNAWHLTGNTIMWLNAGIDSGNIITTETIDIRNAVSLDDAHIRVMEHAHDLYLRAINYLLETASPYNSIPQAQLGKGKLFLNRMWTADKRKQLLRNWKKRNTHSNIAKPVIIPLPGRIN